MAMDITTVGADITTAVTIADMCHGQSTTNHLNIKNTKNTITMTMVAIVEIATTITTIKRVFEF